MLIDIHYAPSIPEADDKASLCERMVAYSPSLHQDVVDRYVAQWDLQWFPKDSAAETTEGSSIKERFLALADRWQQETGHLSATRDIVRNPAYQEIVNMGWDVVPELLLDLQVNRRFWFPALHLITGIRPFDLADAGNSKRMLKAWIRWGQKKGLI